MEEKERILGYLNELREYVAIDKIDWVLKELKTVKLPENYKLQAFQISSRYYSLKQKNISGTIDNEILSVERNKISNSILELIKIIFEDPKLEIDWLHADGNYDNEIASTISQLSADVFRSVNSTPTKDNQEIKSKFLELRNCIVNVILELEENICRGPAWGELSAVIENIEIVLKDKVDEKMLRNLIKNVNRIKIPERGLGMSYLDPILFSLLNKDLIMSYKSSLGYIDGLLKIIE